MDKMIFFEGLEPYDETREAAEILSELAATFSPQPTPETQFLRKEKIIEPLKESKPSYIQIKKTEPEPEEEIVTATVEEAPVKSESFFQLEPIEPILPEEEQERLKITEDILTKTIPDQKGEYETGEVQPPLVHTLESQQAYIEEISKKISDEKDVISAAKTRGEDSQSSAYEETIFDAKMVIEQTQPKRVVDYYLKKEEQIPDSGLQDEKLLASVEDQKSTDVLDFQPPASDIPIVDYTRTEEEQIPSEEDKVLIDLPFGTPPVSAADEYIIDQSVIEDTSSPKDSFVGGYIYEEEKPESKKEEIPDSFKDTDGYRAVITEGKKVDIDKAAEGGSASYTEITLKGQIQEEAAAPDIFEPLKEEKTPELEAFDSWEIPPKEPLPVPDEDAEAIKDRVKEEKASALNDFEFDSSKVKEFKDFQDLPPFPIGTDFDKREKSALPKTPKPKYYKDEGLFGEQEELLAEKTPPTGVEIDKLISPEKKKEEIPSVPLSETRRSIEPLIETIAETKQKAEDVISVAGRAEESKEEEKAPIETFEVKAKQEIKPEKEAEHSEYEKIFSQAKLEAEEFIKEKLKIKESAIPKEKDEEPMPEQAPPDVQSKEESFSDFLSKIRSKRKTKAHPVEQQTPVEAEDKISQPPEITVPPKAAEDKSVGEQKEEGKTKEEVKVTDLNIQPPPAEIADLKYKSVPLDIAEKTEAETKEPKMKSFISKIFKRKEKGVEN